MLVDLVDTIIIEYMVERLYIMHRFKFKCFS